MAAVNDQAGRRLIVNADDFGRSGSINAAVIEAHTNGILTTASLMVNGSAAAEAVALARKSSRLGVGLHLTLVCGSAASPVAAIPALVNAAGQFGNDPVGCGFKYWASRDARRQIAIELQAQFERFKQTGLPLDHVNGHLHFHLHPAVFSALLPLLDVFRVKAVRLTRDPFRLNAQLARGRWGYRVSHALIFQLLSRRAKAQLVRRGIKFTDRVIGLLQDSRADERFTLALLNQLPAGVSELYSHPSLEEFKHELDALVSPSVREAIRRRNIRLIRYSDL